MSFPAQHRRNGMQGGFCKHLSYSVTMLMFKEEDTQRGKMSSQHMESQLLLRLRLRRTSFDLASFEWSEKLHCTHRVVPRVQVMRKHVLLPGGV